MNSYEKMLIEAGKIIQGQLEERQGRQMGDIQRRIQGEVELPNVNIIPRGNDGTPARAGHDERQRAIHHIKEMEAKGYIPTEEATTRIEHAASAEKNSELRVLTSDLPAPVDPRGFWKKWDWDEEKYFIPTLILGMALSVCAAVIPGVLLGRLHEFNTTGGLGLFIPLLVAGVFGFFTCLSVLVVKMS